MKNIVLAGIRSGAETRSAPRAWLVPALLVGLAGGCDAALSEADGGLPVTAEGDPIVNGRACDSSVRKSIVGVGLDSADLPLVLQSRCSGTVVAPNLVLTARHCVASLIGENAAEPECFSDGSANSAVHFGAASADHITIFDDLDSPPLAAAASVIVPSAKSLCNNDIALLVLDRRLSSKIPAGIRVLDSAGKPVSSSKAKVTRDRDPSLTVAGFGLLDAWVENDRGCQQRAVKVLSEATHPTYYLGKHEFSTSYGTCNGDSGGPVFDRDGLLVGVTSRGLASCRGPGVYPDLAYQGSTIVKAMAAAAAMLN